MKSNAPFLMQSTAVSMSAWPEIITIGVSTPSATSFWRTSVPSMPGILMSQKIASYFSFSAISQAAAPFSAVSTWYSSISRISFREFRMDRSSSTIRIFIRSKHLCKYTDFFFYICKTDP